MKSTIRNMIKRSPRLDALLSRWQSRKNREFEPYTIPLPGGGRFYVGTQLAKRWYDPMPHPTRLEYEWVAANVRLRGQRILDCGAHHGQYSVVLALAAGRECELIAVDPYPSNCLIQEVNHLLNKVESRIVRCAVAGRSGSIHFSAQSNGRIVADGGMTVPAMTMAQIMPDAQVVKVDIEGAEYEAMPQALGTMKAVHTWILEIHPAGKPHPDTLIKPMIDRGFQVGVFGDSGQFGPYIPGAAWPTYRTVVARR